mmetsp:Transcript_15286/g.43079  ORF Transcript_15286/g.43079 Transcript_15286/m.43079 type:complete len:306 (+) Transcript_15286:242-1159(+)
MRLGQCGHAILGLLRRHVLHECESAVRSIELLRQPHLPELPEGAEQFQQLLPGCLEWHVANHQLRCVLRRTNLRISCSRRRRRPLVLRRNLEVQRMAIQQPPLHGLQRPPDFIVRLELHEAVSHRRCLSRRRNLPGNSHRDHAARQASFKEVLQGIFCCDEIQIFHVQTRRDAIGCCCYLGVLHAGVWHSLAISDSADIALCTTVCLFAVATAVVIAIVVANTTAIRFFFLSFIRQSRRSCSSRSTNFGLDWSPLKVYRNVLEALVRQLPECLLCQRWMRVLHHCDGLRRWQQNVDRLIAEVEQL